MLRVIATIGIPRSGKSTYAQELLRNDANMRRVNRDAIRELIGLESMHNTPSFEKEVSHIQEAALIRHLKNGKSVVIDDTNLKPSTLNKLKDTVREYCDETGEVVSFSTKLFQTSVDVCMERNEDCKARGDRYVPPEIIQKMYGVLRSNLAQGHISEYTEVIYPSLPVDQDRSLPTAVLCDLDGTLADISHRNPYDASKCLDDSPREAIVKLIHALKDKYTVIFVSGREDTYKEDTTLWLEDQGLSGEVIMRAAGDSRKDSIVKEEILRRDILPRYNVLFTVDDRDQVVRMWRRLGLDCLQVNFGDF